MLGLLCLTRPIWLPYVALCILAVVVTQRDARSWRQMGTVGAAVLLIMLPWVIRNTMIHRSLVIASTEGGIAFLEANNPVSLAE
jgi:uncharacterized membrane protein